MSRFHSLEVEEVRSETPEAVVIGLRIPEALRGDMRFIQGQYLTLRLMVDGEDLRRSYSICSSPLEVGTLRIGVKRVKGGRASTYLVEKLRKGDKLEVMPPMGHFHVPLDPAKSRHFVAFAAGSGITPVLSIVKTVLATEPASRFTLFYGNSSPGHVMFAAELQQLQVAHPERLNVHHVLSRSGATDPLLSGRITGERSAGLLERHVTDGLEKEYFICGPEQMMVEVSGALERRGVDRKHIHIELFTTPVSAEARKETDHSHGSTGTFSGSAEVKVILDGREHTITIPAKGDGILDSAIDAGLDVPYACKGAVCCTCKARVLEGKVEMDMNYALTDEEVAQGYVLTCQSHPRSPHVVVDYDQH